MLSNQQNQKRQSNQAEIARFQDQLMAQLSTQLQHFLQQKKISVLECDHQVYSDFLDQYNKQGTLFDDREMQDNKIFWSYIKQLELSAASIIERAPRLFVPANVYHPQTPAIVQKQLLQSIYDQCTPLQKQIFDATLDSYRLGTESMFWSNYQQFRQQLSAFQAWLYQAGMTTQQREILINQKITNDQLLTECKNAGVITASDYDDIITKPTKDWNPQMRKTIETLSAQAIIDTYKTKADNVITLLEQTKSFYEFPSINNLLKGVDIDQQKVNQVNQNDQLTPAQKLKQHCDDYCQTLRQAGKNDLADIFQQAFIHDNEKTVLDFSKINAQSKAHLIEACKQHFVKNPWYSNLIKLLGLEEAGSSYRKDLLNTVVSDLFDPSKMTIQLPILGGIKQFVINDRRFSSHHISIEHISDIKDNNIVPYQLVIDPFQWDNHEILKQIWVWKSAACLIQNGRDQEVTHLTDADGNELTNYHRISYQKQDGTIVEWYPHISKQGNQQEIILTQEPYFNPWKNNTIVGAIDASTYQPGRVRTLDVKFVLSGDDIINILLTATMGVADINPDRQQQKKRQDYIDQQAQRNKKIESKLEDTKQEELKSEEDLERQKMKFLDQWRKIPGQVMQGPHWWFQKGTALYFNLDSTIDEQFRQPDMIGQSWWKLIIDDVNRDEGTFVFTVSGTDSKPWTKKIGATMSQDFFSLLGEKFGATQQYKFQHTTDKNKLKTFFQTMSVELPDSEIAASWDALSHLDRTAGQPKDILGQSVHHFGKVFDSIVKDEKDQDIVVSQTRFYKTIVTSRGIEITPIDQNGKSLLSDPIVMDYASFMIFVANKDIKPYNDQQYKDAIKKEQEKKQADSKKRSVQWYSIGNISAFFSSIKDGFVKHFKDADDKRTKEFAWMANEWLIDNGIYSVLGNIPIIGNVFADIKDNFESERDYTIWKEITETIEGFKKAAKVDANNVTEDIKKMIETNDPNKRYDRLGALLFCIENGDPYLRKLWPLSGKGMRVKSLLGEAQHAKFIKERKQKIALRDSLTENDDNVDEYMRDVNRFEISYILKFLDENKDIKDKKFSMQFRAELEMKYVQMISYSSLQKGYQDEAESGAWFNQLYANFKAHLWNFRPVKALGSFKAMVANANTQEEVQRVKLAFSIWMASGMFTNKLNKAWRDYIDSIARKIWFPLGYYVKDPHGWQKMMMLIKAAAKATWSTHPYDWQVWWFNRSESNLDPQTFSANVKDMITKVDNRWLADTNNKDSRRKICEFLSQKSVGLPGTRTIFDLIEKEQNPLVKKNLQDLIQKSVNLDDMGLLDNDVGNKSFYTANIFTVSKRTIQEYINYNPQTGEFINQKKDISIKFWQAFNSSLWSLSAKWSLSKQEFIVRLQQLIGGFETKFYTPKNKEIVAQLLLTASNNWLGGLRTKKELIQYATTKLAESTALLPADIAQVMGHLETIITNNINHCNPDTLAQIFGKENMVNFERLTDIQEDPDVKKIIADCKQNGKLSFFKSSQKWQKVKQLAQLKQYVMEKFWQQQWSKFWMRAERYQSIEKYCTSIDKKIEQRTAWWFVMADYYSGYENYADYDDILDFV